MHHILESALQERRRQQQRPPRTSSCRANSRAAASTSSCRRPARLPVLDAHHQLRQPHRLRRCRRQLRPAPAPPPCPPDAPPTPPAAPAVANRTASNPAARSSSTITHQAKLSSWSNAAVKSFNATLTCSTPRHPRRQVQQVAPPSPPPDDAPATPRHPPRSPPDAGRPVVQQHRRRRPPTRPRRPRQHHRPTPQQLRHASTTPPAPQTAAPPAAHPGGSAPAAGVRGQVGSSRRRALATMRDDEPSRAKVQLFVGLPTSPTCTRGTLLLHPAEPPDATPPPEQPLCCTAAPVAQGIEQRFLNRVSSSNPAGAPPLARHNRALTCKNRRGSDLVLSAMADRSRLLRVFVPNTCRSSAPSRRVAMRCWRPGPARAGTWHRP